MTIEINPTSAQVEVIDLYGRVYLYTHDHSDDIVSIVYDTLVLGKRWDDADYLSGMIFCRMLACKDPDDDSGYGIGSQLYATVNVLISLDIEKQTITINSALDKSSRYTMSFHDFVRTYPGSARL